jgi:asparagine synthase (glutamine-hydrolysing)
MGVQFGICNCDGEPVDNDVLERVESLLVPYAPEGISVLRRESCALLYGSCETRTTSGSQQPYRLPDRNWIMWDGRLDNRGDLRRASIGLGVADTDAEVVACAYQSFGTQMFSHLIGDWAISIFSEARQEVVLARDFIGSRPLFYRSDNHQTTWSTVLEPLVFLGPEVPQVSGSYLAGWMSSYPHSHLTPYEGVRSVPPSSTVRMRAGQTSVRKYWDFDPGLAIRHRNDKDYEEQFYSIFREAVRRRIDSSNPVLAELSGGMDSSSIVCMADSLLAAGHCQTSRLDTITYFDVREPNWDELPYARIVEQQRGRAGCHIDVGPESLDQKGPTRNRFRMIPSSPYTRSSAADSFRQLLSGGGYRVVLSGLGGDEILGGVPTPVPELADLLVGLKVRQFLAQSFEWALAKRKPILKLWSSVLRQFLPRSPRYSRQSFRLCWLTTEFIARHRHELSFSSRRTRLTGGSPSFQANLEAVESLRSQLSCTTLESAPTFEWRYPFLDRELMSFCFSIPREQMVRPHERRSLMRRALAATVPRQILDRKRKAYVSRALVKVISAEYMRLRDSTPLRVEELGIVDCSELEHAVQNADQGRDVATVSLLRTLALEDWLRELRNQQSLVRELVFRKDHATRVVRCSDQELLGREN